MRISTTTTTCAATRCWRWRWEKHAEPAGANRARLRRQSAAEGLGKAGDQKDRGRPGEHRCLARGSVLGSPPTGSRTYPAGFGCHRRSFVWPSGRALLSRLLPGLLLSAAVHILRRASVKCTLADVQHRYLRRFGRGTGAAGGAHSPALAAGEDSVARGCRLLPGETDGLVRGCGPRLHLRIGAESASEETDRCRDDAGRATVRANPGARPSVHGVSLCDAG